MSNAKEREAAAVRAIDAFADTYGIVDDSFDGSDDGLMSTDILCAHADELYDLLHVLIVARAAVKAEVK